jgi:hypothetical protein
MPARVCCAANVWGDTEKRWSMRPLQWSIDGLVLAPPPGSEMVPAEEGAAEQRDAGRETHDSDRKRYGQMKTNRIM